MHRRELVETLDQALVAQIAHHQRLGCLAEGHQRDHLAAVEVEGKRVLARDMNLASQSFVVDHLHRGGGPSHGAGERQHRRIGGSAERNLENRGRMRKIGHGAWRNTGSSSDSNRGRRWRPSRRGAARGYDSGHHHMELTQ